MISFRPPVLKDVEEVARVHVSCWQEAYAGIMDADFLRSLSVEKRAEGWRATVEDDKVFAHLACDGGQIVGFVASGPSHSPEFADGEIYAMYLRASHYNRGIGKALFLQAIGDWKARGGIKMLANVILGNDRAIVFYGKMGGMELGEEDFEIGGMKLREKVMVFEIAANS